MTEGIDLQLDLIRSTFRLQANLQLPGRGVTAFFGPSGSGKTTLLRAIAGLEKTPHATIRINGDTWQHGDYFKPVHQRALGYVFQEASLFPHLSVQQNLAFGEKRIAPAQRRVKQEHAIELLGIAHLLARRPDTLSGGERQRVAIARALLTSPELLLMDEPLASLDTQRKAEILPYLEKLHDELEIPLLYVSHSPDEVARLADHIVLLENGAVIASGPLSDTLARLDLSRIFKEDASVVIHTRIAAHESEDYLSRLAFPGGELFVNQRPYAIGHPLRCRIMARDVSITLARQSDTSILNALEAVVTGFAETDHPARVLVRLNAGTTPLLARITHRSLKNLGLEIGKPVWAQIKAVALLD